MESIITVHITRLPEGVYLATSDDVQGLVAQGRTVSETLEIARDVVKKLLEAQGKPPARIKRVGKSFDYPLVVGTQLGRLAGFSYREVVKKLKKLGFEFHRQAAGSHEIWHNPETDLYTTVPNHPGDLPEGTLRAILTQAGIKSEEFLSAQLATYMSVTSGDGAAGSATNATNATNEFPGLPSPVSGNSLARVERFEDLEVWQEGVRLSIDLYETLSQANDFGLGNQIQRSAVSIPSNIAEGDAPLHFPVSLMRGPKGEPGI